jgi:hypothetical protein
LRFEILEQNSLKAHHSLFFNKNFEGGMSTEDDVSTEEWGNDEDQDGFSADEE